MKDEEDLIGWRCELKIMDLSPQALKLIISGLDKS
jgi:hypothetical protein